MIGIDTNTGHLYKGNSAPSYPVWPNPAVSQAKLIRSPSDRESLPTSLDNDPRALIFREESFDAVTRVRRGRLYGPQASQPQQFAVYAHPFDHDEVQRVAAARNLLKTLYTYDPYDEVLRSRNQGVGLDMAVGSGYASIWRIVQTERLANRDVLVTLKALTAFGVLPDIDDEKVLAGFLAGVRDAMERASDSAYREMPTSVIDQCRNAANAALSRWRVQQGADPAVLNVDLGATLKGVQQDAPTMQATWFAGSLINRLHPRGKVNEQGAKGLRVPVEEDALIAIQALGFMLREIGWAKS